MYGIKSQLIFSCIVFSFFLLLRKSTIYFKGGHMGSKQVILKIAYLPLTVTAHLPPYKLATSSNRNSLVSCIGPMVQEGNLPTFSLPF